MLILNRFSRGITRSDRLINLNVEDQKMKRITLAIVIAGTLSAATAFAQSAPAGSAGGTQMSSQAAQVASNVTSAGAASGQWVPPYGQPVAPKTRAQVYQELVHAEQDGQLAYLNSTIYAHP